MKPGIIILAAGESARMGVPKQLLEYRGKTLLERTADVALEVGDSVIVVLGSRAEQIWKAWNEPRVMVVENPRWSQGMGGSLAIGLQSLLIAKPATQAAIFLLCDQPLLTATVLRRLIATHLNTGSAIVASEYNETLGVPALFHASLFPELLALKGKEGARKVIQSHPRQVVGVPFAEGSLDIDTPADWAQLHISTTLMPL